MGAARKRMSRKQRQNRPAGTSSYRTVSPTCSTNMPQARPRERTRDDRECKKCSESTPGCEYACIDCGYAYCSSACRAIDDRHMKYCSGAKASGTHQRVPVVPTGSILRKLAQPGQCMLALGLQVHEQCLGYHIGYKCVGRASQHRHYVEMHIANKPFETPTGSSVTFTRNMLPKVAGRGYFGAHERPHRLFPQLKEMKVKLSERLRRARIMREQRSLLKAIARRQAESERQKGLTTVKNAVGKEKIKLLKRWRNKENKLGSAVMNLEGYMKWYKRKKPHTQTTTQKDGTKHPTTLRKWCSVDGEEQDRIKRNSQKLRECEERITQVKEKEPKEKLWDSREYHTNPSTESCVAIRVKRAGIGKTGRRKPYKRTLGVLRFTTHPV